MTDRIKTYVSGAHAAETAKALAIMHDKHSGQFRDSKDPDVKIPYEVHPLGVAVQALKLGIREDDFIAVCLLHDVVEDSGVAASELEVNETVRTAVEVLSYSPVPGLSKEESKSRYFEAISRNRISAMVKLLDRCNNLAGMADAFSKERTAKYIAETERFVIPLAHKVQELYPEFAGAALQVEKQMKSIIENA